VEALQSNDNIKKLSGREYQNLMRIVRQYMQEKITLEMARTMLSAGFGLSAQEIDTMLGVQAQEFSEPTWGQDDDEDYGWGEEEFKVLEVVASKFGSHADDYHVMHSKPMRFDTNIDENIRLAFAELGEEEVELDKKIEAYRKKNRDLRGIGYAGRQRFNVCTQPNTAGGLHPACDDSVALLRVAHGLSV
jgi:hypothetical protein